MNSTNVLRGRAVLCAAGVFVLSIGSLTTTAAAGVRSAPIHVSQLRAVTSIAAAARAAPPSGIGISEDSKRGGDHEAKFELLLNKFRAERLALLSPLARAASVALPLPRVRSMNLTPAASFGFNGLSNVDQANVNLGFSVEPPDQALCTGNGFVFEGVNDAFAVYNERGQLLAGPAQANAFFGVDFSLNVSDPKCYFDTASDRWFVTMTEYDSLLSDNHIKIAVSQSGDPTGGFIIYDLNITNDGSDFIPGGADCPCLGDQPLIGADANGFYISTNAYGGFSYEGAQIYVISKAALAAGVANPAAVHFDQLSYLLPSVEYSFSIQPSTTPPGAAFAPNTEFLSQSFNALTKENQLAVFAISNTSAIDGDVTRMSISAAFTPSEVYVTPVPANQKAGPTPLAVAVADLDNPPGPFGEQDLDANDQRMGQLTYLNGQLWTTVGTASVGEGTPVRDAMAWFVINVSNSSTGPMAGIASQGYVAGPGTSHLIYPALAVNARGRAAAVFTLTGPQYFPSAAFWKFGSNHTIHELAQGKAAQDGFSAYYYNRPRWGDYSAAAVGADGALWLATEYIPGGFRKQSANWGTFVGRSRADDENDN